MITGFNHTGFVVRDIEKMTAFYRDVLGLVVQFGAEVEFRTSAAQPLRG